MTKPRIRLLSGKYGGYWVCTHYGFAGRGENPKEAYNSLRKRFFDMYRGMMWH